MNVDFGVTPVSTQTPKLSALDHVSTMVAQTLQVFTQQAPTITPTATPEPTATATVVFVAPVLTVSQDTHCTTGPGTSYGIVMTLHPGSLAVPVAKDSAVNYWVIEAPNYAGSSCWLSGEFATVTGDINNLPEVSAPAVSAYTLSEAKSLRVSCSSRPVSSSSDPHEPSIWTVVFRWKNTEPYQTGIRVFRNGRKIATLGAHASSFVDEFRLDHRHSGVTYGVQVFNNTQVSSITTIEVRHCEGE
jgi:hypothetical protein